LKSSALVKRELVEETEARNLLLPDSVTVDTQPDEGTKEEFAEFERLLVRPENEGAKTLHHLYHSSVRVADLFIRGWRSRR
jgi:hypothetical protein